MTPSSREAPWLLGVPTACPPPFVCYRRNRYFPHDHHHHPTRMCVSHTNQMTAITIHMDLDASTRVRSKNRTNTQVDSRCNGKLMISHTVDSTTNRSIGNPPSTKHQMISSPMGVKRGSPFVSYNAVIQTGSCFCWVMPPVILEKIRGERRIANSPMRMLFHAKRFMMSDLTATTPKMLAHRFFSGMAAWRSLSEDLREGFPFADGKAILRGALLLRKKTSHMGSQRVFLHDVRRKASGRRSLEAIVHGQFATRRQHHEILASTDKGRFLFFRKAIREQRKNGLHVRIILPKGAIGRKTLGAHPMQPRRLHPTTADIPPIILRFHHQKAIGRQHNMIRLRPFSSIGKQKIVQQDGFSMPDGLSKLLRNDAFAFLAEAARPALMAKGPKKAKRTQKGNQKEAKQRDVHEDSPRRYASTFS